MKWRSFFLVGMGIVSAMSFSMNIDTGMDIDVDLFFEKRDSTKKEVEKAVTKAWMQLPSYKILKKIFTQNGLSDFAIQTGVAFELAHQTISFNSMSVAFALAVAEYDRKQEYYEDFTSKVNVLVEKLYEKYQIKLIEE